MGARHERGGRKTPFASLKHQAERTDMANEPILSTSRRDMLATAAVGGILGMASLPTSASAGSANSSENMSTVEISTPANAIVETAAGKVRGYVRNGIFTYKGIPYGADTSGTNRFLPPRKPTPWAGIRDTLGYGQVSPHPVRRDWGQQQTQFVYDWDDGYPGEDCLQLNVWTRDVNPSARRPVMVWIHGGGFTSGSSQELPSYDGENLARQGVVLVSLNHRLGPLGFLDLSEIGGDAYRHSGNASVLDMILALEWVRDNIAQFGGDPGRITIFGQSGGGAKVSVLMATERAKGLFHRAIVMSGSFIDTPEQTESRALAAATLSELGIAKGDLGKLQAVSAQELLQAGDRAIGKLNPGGMNLFALGKRLRLPRSGWGPVVDGDVFKEHPWRERAPSASRDVPLIVGTTREEFRDPSTHDIDWTGLENRLAPTFPGERAAKIIAAFRAAFPVASAGVIAGIIGGMSWREDALRQATLKAKQGGAPAYNYWFTWQPQVLDGRPGAFHCLDLAFCFDNTARCAQATGNTPQAQKLASVMSAAWRSFAETGRPVLPDLNWPAFNAETMPALVFDNESQLANDPAGAARRALFA